MHPHDYYAPYSDEPHLHNRHAGRHYVEPDWQANAAGHQLPVLSTVGRGPRGEGLQIGNVVEQDGVESFALYSTLTGELLWQSPNLAPGDLSFEALSFDQLSAGQAAPLDIKWTRGGTTKTTHAYLPCGERGSFIYLLKEALQRNATDIYQVTMGQLVMYKRDTWPNHKKPNAKVNDIVMCHVTDDTGSYLAIGDIVNVGSRNNEEIAEDTPVQFVVRTEIPCIDPNKKASGLVLRLSEAREIRYGQDYVFDNITFKDIFDSLEAGYVPTLVEDIGTGDDYYNGRWLPLEVVESNLHHAEGPYWIHFGWRGLTWVSNTNDNPTKEDALNEPLCVNFVY